MCKITRLRGAVGGVRGGGGAGSCWQCTASASCCATCAHSPTPSPCKSLKGVDCSARVDCTRALERANKPPMKGTVGRSAITPQARPTCARQAAPGQHTRPSYADPAAASACAPVAVATAAAAAPAAASLASLARVWKGFTTGWHTAGVPSPRSASHSASRTREGRHREMEPSQLQRGPTHQSVGKEPTTMGMRWSLVRSGALAPKALARGHTVPQVGHTHTPGAGNDGQLGVP
jgi:hypothetical protein